MFVLLTNWIERMFVTQTWGQRRVSGTSLIHFAFGHAYSALKQNADKGKHFTGALTQQLCDTWIRRQDIFVCHDGHSVRLSNAQRHQFFAVSWLGGRLHYKYDTDQFLFSTLLEFKGHRNWKDAKRFKTPSKKRKEKKLINQHALCDPSSLLLGQEKRRKKMFTCCTNRSEQSVILLVNSLQRDVILCWKQTSNMQESSGPGAGNLSRSNCFIISLNLCCRMSKTICQNLRTSLKNTEDGPLFSLM